MNNSTLSRVANVSQKVPAALKSRPILTLFFLILVLSLIIFIYKTTKSANVFRTAQITRGDLSVNISATGTVEPEEVIDVGAQVAGLILSFGKDILGKPIDYGSEVEEGTILAQIDQSLYTSDVEQADAELKRSKADLLQMQAKQLQAERDWKRAEKLGPSDALSQSAYDSYKAAFDVTKANVSVGEAQVVQAEAVLAKAQRNLGYCTIKSPVKGVIIDRRVNIGQTVVSSLNAPSLFLIAKDLKRMQVWISVNEADIGNIHPGQSVTFVVDAFPGEEFKGEVGKIRLNATMTQNVVTYIVEVTTDNSSGKLLPYLTANARFEVTNSKNVLLVPNGALRWSPKPNQIAPDYKKKKNNSKTGSATEGLENKVGAEQGTIWVPDGTYARPITVLTSGTDGINTQVESAEIAEDSKVIIGEVVENSQNAKSGATTNPFAPTVMRGGGRRN